MLNLKKLIVKALVSEIKISDAILIAANNAVSANDTLESNQVQQTKGVSK